MHLWKNQDKEDIFNKIKETDILLHQPISEINFGIYSSENLKKYLKKNVQVISFPNLYFTGYHPQAQYLKDDLGNKVDGPFDYHDINIIQAYKDKSTIEDVIQIFLDKSFYSKEEIKKVVDKSLLDLENREILANIGNFTNILPPLSLFTFR